MGNDRPVKVKCWEKFLKSKDCYYKSTEASHDKWRCPNCVRSIVFRGAKKEIPFAHISSNLSSMGVPKEEFLGWVKENC